MTEVDDAKRRDWDLRELLSAVLEHRLMEVFTGFVGRVEAYDAATQTADIQPVIRRAVPKERGGVVHEQLPVVPSVPVLFQRSGAFAVTFPLSAGDSVLCVCTREDYSRWRQTGDVADPADRRLHHPSSAIAIPGLFPMAAPAPGASDTDLVIAHSGGTRLRIAEGVVYIDAERIEAGGDRLIADAAKSNTHFANIAAALASATAPSSGGAVTYDSPFTFDQSVATEKLRGG